MTTPFTDNPQVKETMVHRAPVEVFWLASFILGICLWIYLHDKE